MPRALIHSRAIDPDLRSPWTDLQRIVQGRHSYQRRCPSALHTHHSAVVNCKRALPNQNHAKEHEPRCDVKVFRRDSASSLLLLDEIIFSFQTRIIVPVWRFMLSPLSQGEEVSEEVSFLRRLTSPSVLHPSARPSALRNAKINGSHESL